MDSPLASFYALHAAGYVLVFSRVLGLFVFAPLLSGVSVPVAFRVLLAAMLSLGVYAALRPEHRALPDVPISTLAFMLVTEVIIGAGIGLIASMPLMAVEAAGQIIGYQLGFGIARASNPSLDINADAAGMMLFVMTVGIFLSMGGLDATIAVMLSTFGAVPPGGAALAAAPLASYVDLAHDATELAVRLAWPVVGVVLVVLGVIGILGRLMPQLNVMAVGFAIKILVGSCMLIFALFVSADVLAEFIQHAVHAAADWASTLTAEPSGAPGG